MYSIKENNFIFESFSKKDESNEINKKINKPEKILFINGENIFVDPEDRYKYKYFLIKRILW